MGNARFHNHENDGITLWSIADLWKINKWIKRTLFLLPNIQELVLKLVDSQFYILRSEHEILLYKIIRPHVKVHTTVFPWGKYK